MLIITTVSYFWILVTFDTAGESNHFVRKGRKKYMNKRDFTNMSDEERLKALAEMPEEDIDYSDIPEIDEEFLANAKFIKNPFKNSNDSPALVVISKAAQDARTTRL